MKSFDRLVSLAERIVMIASYLTLILLVGAETIRRMLLSQQAAWGPEIALFAFIWLSWFAMSYCIRYDLHLSFTEIRDRLPRQARKVLEMIDCILWLIVGFTMIVTSIKMVEMNIQFDQRIFGTQIPLVAASLAVPIGWMFAMIRVLQKLVGILRNDPVGNVAGTQTELPESL